MEGAGENGHQAYLTPLAIAAAPMSHEKAYEIDEKTSVVSELEGSPATSRPPSYTEIQHDSRK